MSIEIISVGQWVGSAEQCEEIRQLARDYNWGPDRIEDAEYAADVAVSELTADIEDPHPDAEAKLRGALVASAEKARA